MGKKTFTRTELREYAQSLVDNEDNDEQARLIVQEWLDSNPELKPLPILTKRQADIFQYIKRCVNSARICPTVREIGSEFGIKSPNGVMCHLRALEHKGLISRLSNRSRGIQIADGY